ncbi:hypothetical protein FBF24_01550 [Candidatus Saccharibacteria bacterium oral taxon 488]|nr:hypothetical protein FBF24_01550 [Candidatus Saccharibacteria bacterium oral taxon 488]
MKSIDGSTQQCSSKLSISSPESFMSEHIFDRQKWQSLTIFEQMGNIGSEVGRAFAAQRRGDTAAMTGAWQRGLDLLDATAEQLARQKSPKLREVLRARELFAGMEDESLEGYFMWFVVAARRDE